MVESSWIEVVKDAIQTGTFGRDASCAWLYGGRAIAPKKATGDVDLIVVRAQATPERRSITLADGTVVNCNIIGRRCLSGQEDERRGFYFTSKLMGPRQLLWGDRETGDRLLARAVSVIRPWSQALFGDRDGDASDSGFALSLPRAGRSRGVA